MGAVKARSGQARGGIRRSGAPGSPKGGSLTDPAFPTWSLSAKGTPPARVEWWTRQPLAFVGSWEPLTFRRRAGYAYTDEEEFVANSEFSESALASFQEAGANALVIPFAKGFGLKAVGPELRQEQDLVRRAKRQGLKTGAYIRVDYSVPETLHADCPDVADWLARGMYGHTSAYYPQQTFRRRLCLLQPGAVKWLERLFTYAFRELKADFLHLDGFGGITTRSWDNCRCELCLNSYRTWLSERLVTPLERERLFGVADFNRIQIPEFEVSKPLPGVISSPDVQMWYRYLLEREEAFVRHTRRFTQRLDPGFAISGNFGWMRTAGAPRWFARNVERLIPWLDALWTEDSDHLSFTEGRIRSRLGVFKTAREYGASLCHYHWQSEDPELEASLALSLAANGGSLSCLGFSFRYLAHYSLGMEPKARFARWMLENRPLIADTVPSGDIALIRHTDSLAWNDGKPADSARRIEQLLVRMQIPWRMFDGIDGHRLGQVQTAILPDAESLSDGEIDLLNTWVLKGGRLLITAGTATHDENRRRRPRNGLLERVGNFPVHRSGLSPAQEWLHWFRNDFTEFETRDSILPGWMPVIHPHGKGVLGLWPEISASRKGKGTPAKAIETFLRKLHGPMRIQVQGPPSLLVDCNRQPATEETLIHLVRTDPGTRPISVSIRNSSGWKGCRVLSPDLRPPVLQINGKTLRLSRLGRYAVVVFPSPNPAGAGANGGGGARRPGEKRLPSPPD